MWTIEPIILLSTSPLYINRFTHFVWDCFESQRHHSARFRHTQVMWTRNWASSTPEGASDDDDDDNDDAAAAVAAGWWLQIVDALSRGKCLILSQELEGGAFNPCPCAWQHVRTTDEPDSIQGLESRSWRFGTSGGLWGLTRCWHGEHEETMANPTRNRPSLGILWTSVCPYVGKRR